MLVLLLCIGSVMQLQAQTVWENPETPVMGYLQRMAQKGKIDLQDIIQPISRKQIETALLELEKIANDPKVTEGSKDAMNNTFV